VKKSVLTLIASHLPQLGKTFRCESTSVRVLLPVPVPIDLQSNQSSHKA